MQKYKKIAIKPLMHADYYNFSLLFAFSLCLFGFIIVCPHNETVSKFAFCQ